MSSTIKSPLTQRPAAPAFSLSEAHQLGGDFNKPHADRVTGIRRLMDRFKAGFRFLFDDHVLEIVCRNCGEPLRFTHKAPADVIEAEITGHECKAKASA